jgi:hypothetical protein
MSKAHQFHRNGELPEEELRWHSTARQLPYEELLRKLAKRNALLLPWQGLITPLRPE